MNPSRRGFLKFFAAATVAAPLVLDPEKLLWVRGAKTISIPLVVTPTFDELSAITLAAIRRETIADNFFVDSTWLKILRSEAVKYTGYTGRLFYQEPIIYSR